MTSGSGFSDLFCLDPGKRQAEQEANSDDGLTGVVHTQASLTLIR